MNHCIHVACFFLAKAYREGGFETLTNLKLQKLLYYSQCLYLALYDEPLFADEMQAWRYGPVCPPAYRFYTTFEAEQRPYASLEPPKLTPEKREVLEEVWQYFSPYSAWGLSGMTHQEFPWMKARAGLPCEARSTAAIDLQDMKILGYEWLDRIERQHLQYEANNREALASAIGDLKTANQIPGKAVYDWLNSVLD